jgi:glutamate synthase domain-containing protein 2
MMLSGSLSFLAVFFIFITGLIVLALAVTYFIDVSQTKDTIRHNYPVIGRFRHFFTFLGEFFRQYFFAMDREEMPFNRAERDWVYQSSKGQDNTHAFGSTRSLSPVGTPIFVNAAFPPLDDHKDNLAPVTIGPYARNPYNARSLINISAMSFGALSRPAIQALSKGAELAGCWLNTGEGGLSPHHLAGKCDIVFQLGTAKYGARDENGNLDPDKLRAIAKNRQVKMVELKLAQGAKPGKGGILPAGKVTREIAEIRGIPEGEASISPNRHTDAGNIIELLQLIEEMRQISGLPTGFKTVISSRIWCDDLCKAIKKHGLKKAPDFITIDSGDGGTGAAPMPLMDNVGLPISESLPMMVEALSRHNLRDRVKVIASGKLITPAEVAWAYCAGADFVNSARGFMFALGCIQALKCNKNTCPTGITTHDERLQQGLDPANKAERVKRYVEKIHYGTGIIANSCGVESPRQLQPHHVRIVQPNGTSIPLDELHRKT